MRRNDLMQKCPKALCKIEILLSVSQAFLFLLLLLDHFYISVSPITFPQLDGSVANIFT